jgi:Kef-type K+ transport system membrane component KefB
LGAGADRFGRCPGEQTFRGVVGIKMARMPVDQSAWAIAFGLNARGATGIILAGVGRAAGVIDDRIFVAIVVMALATSLLAGPMMNWLLSDRIAEMSVGGGRVADAVE